MKLIYTLLLVGLFQGVALGKPGEFYPVTVTRLGVEQYQIDGTQKYVETQACTYYSYYHQKSLATIYWHSRGSEHNRIMFENDKGDIIGECRIVRCYEQVETDP